MENKNYFDLPEINGKNFNPNYYYQASTYNKYGQCTNKLKDVLDYCRCFVSDLEFDTVFENEKYAPDAGIRYVKVHTKDGKYMVMTLSEDQVELTKNIQSMYQDMIKIELYIKDRELNTNYTPSIIYTSDREAYLTPRDIHILGMYKPEDIKAAIILATTEKLFENKTRKRK